MALEGEAGTGGPVAGKGRQAAWRPGAWRPGRWHPGQWLCDRWPLVLWLVFIAVIAVLAVARPMRPITRIYSASALDWWAGVPVYTEGIHGFLYLPASALLFTPFALLPLPLADQLWRLAMLAVFSWAVWRAAALVRPDAPARTARIVLALAIPTAAIDVLRNQFELMMFAMMLHAAVDMARGDDRRGGLTLALAVALKPLALVPALLAGAVRPGTRRWLAIGLAVALVAPFIHPDPAYVAGQYGAMVAKLRTAAAPDSGTWFDLTVFLETWGWRPDYDTMTLVRIAAAAVTLGAAVLAARRLDRVSAALATLTLAVCYLLLFNPRVEEGSYVNLAVIAGLLACVEARRRPGTALPVVLGALVFGLGTHFYGDWIYRPTASWLKQALCLTVYAYLGFAVATRRRLADPEPLPAPPGLWRHDRVALVVALGAVPVFAVARFIARVPLRHWLSSLDGLDYLVLVIAANVIAFGLMAAAGPVWAWMRASRQS
jgi:hypothetical protein